MTPSLSSFKLKSHPQLTMNPADTPTAKTLLPEISVTKPFGNIFPTTFCPSTTSPRLLTVPNTVPFGVIGSKFLSTIPPITFIPKDRTLPTTSLRPIILPLSDLTTPLSSIYPITRPFLSNVKLTVLPFEPIILPFASVTLPFASAWPIILPFSSITSPFSSI